MPTGADWIVHLNRDLAPYWSMPAALGTPVGYFPTNRYQDGTVIDPDGELRDGLDEWEKEFDGVRDLMRVQFTVPISRQVFAYCTLFHLTGQERFLGYARAGIDFLFQRGRDEEGIPFTYIRDGVGGPGTEHRTAQEMSYQLLGPSFYYYLTRDPDVLAQILPVKEYIFNHYGGEDWQYLRWCDEEFVDLSGDMTHSPESLALTAQLDQMNAYLMLMTPILPDEDMQAEWRQDLEKLSDLLVEEYYDEEENLFWGDVSNPDSLSLSTPNTDFGHTGKSLWFIWQVARDKGDTKRIAWAQERAARLAEQAFLGDLGAWAMARGEEGVIRHRLWWTYAEMDQLMATMSLRDPSLQRYLARTYDYWMRKFVDYRYGEVWAWIDDEGDEAEPWKQWQWKNGFHSLEHAMVGYITAQASVDQPVTLYYAFDKTPTTEEIHPYLYRGTVASVRERDAVERPEGKIQQIMFTGVQ
jgi:mannose/cellobiose epimerase-like protein (N-acyl-D-glucosamine 2-epimerase family)